MNNLIYNALCREIDFLIHAKQHAVVVIDGKAASGKSSFVQELSEKYSAPVVHMDDFFLPEALRTPERYAQAGGNIHYERFAEEALPSLNAREGFSYRKYDCKSKSYIDTVSIPSASVVFVEGAYAMHPSFGHYYDLALFMDVEDELQRQRILKRNGESGLKDFLERWIPYENAYFDNCQVIERCDHIIEY